MSISFTLSHSTSSSYPAFFRNIKNLGTTERKGKCLVGDDCLQGALTGGGAEAVAVPRELQEEEEMPEAEAEENLEAEEEEEEKVGGKGMERWD